MQGGVGTRDDKTQPNLAKAQRTIQRSRYFVSQSKPGLQAHDSGSCGSVCFMMFLLPFFRQRSKTFGWVIPLPFKLRLLRETICKTFYFEMCHFWNTASVYPKILFCQNIILPKYCYAKSFSHISWGRCLH